MDPVMVLLLYGLGVSWARFPLSDEQYYQLPRLFHLDDYEACLSQRGAVYCLGSFHLTPTSSQHQLYGVMKNFSRRVSSFNHSLLHRGYCITARCPLPGGSRNLSRHFQSCVDTRARRSGLRAHLHRLAYCRSTADLAQGPPYDVYELLFAGVLALILVVNVAGTIYDLYNTHQIKANNLLLAWSVRLSWRRLMTPERDLRLQCLRPIEGMRVITSLFMVMFHHMLIIYTTYLQNPLKLEKMSEWWLLFMSNITIMVQLYAVQSGLVLGYQLLLNQEDGRQIPLWRRLYNRLTRIAPAYWLMVGFAATWWRRLGSGPMWWLVTAETDTCRRNWWPQFLFLHNMVRPENKCLMPTWFVASDMQVHLLSLAVMVLVLRGPSPRRMLRPLALAVLALVVGVFCIVYFFDIKECMFVANFEELRKTFAGNSSFSWLYTAWWGNAVAGLLGLGLAVVLRAQQRLQLKPNKWMALSSHLYGPWALCLWWVSAGVWTRQLQSPPLVALYSALARPGGALITCFYFYGLCCNIDPTFAWLSWPHWRVLARLSLPVSLLHWCVNLALVAARPQPAHVSLPAMLGESAVVWLVTHLLALPLALLVQYPVQQFLRQLVDAQSHTNGSIKSIADQK